MQMCHRNFLHQFKYRDQNQFKSPVARMSRLPSQESTTHPSLNRNAQERTHLSNFINRANSRTSSPEQKIIWTQLLVIILKCSNSRNPTLTQARCSRQTHPTRTSSSLQLLVFLYFLTNPHSRGSATSSSWTYKDSIMSSNTNTKSSIRTPLTYRKRAATKILPTKSSIPTLPTYCTSRLTSRRWVPRTDQTWLIRQFSISA